jgi:hypothetical protein
VSANLADRPQSTRPQSWIRVADCCIQWLPWIDAMHGRTRHSNSALEWVSGRQQVLDDPLQVLRRDPAERRHQSGLCRRRRFPD